MSTQYSTGTGPTIIDPSKVHLLEADIEEYLWQNPGAVSIYFFHGVKRWLKRQYSVPSGIIDLLGITNTGLPVVVEVKDDPLLSKDIAQVSRYALDVHRILGDRIGFPYPDGVFKILVGPSVDTSVFRECEACGVSVIQYQVSLNLSTTHLSWTSEFRKERYEQWNALSVDPALDDDGWYRREDEYSDVILGDSENSVADAVEDYLEQIVGEDGNEAAV